MKIKECIGLVVGGILSTSIFDASYGMEAFHKAQKEFDEIVNLNQKEQNLTNEIKRLSEVAKPSDEEKKRIEGLEKELKTVQREQYIPFWKKQIAESKTSTSLELLGGDVHPSLIQDIQGLTHLTHLYLEGGNHLTDKDLSPLKTLVNLKVLSLKNCKMITDNTLEMISQFSQIENLNLQFCFEITDVGLDYLKKLTKLKKLSLLGVQKKITIEKLLELQSALPSTQIESVLFKFQKDILKKK